MKYAHIGLVALAAVLIAGCGGSSNKTNGETGTDAPMSGADAPMTDADEPEVFKVDLPPGHGLSAAGEFDIEADKSVTTGSGAVFSCPATATDGCIVTVVANATLDTYTATSTGGEVTVTPPVNPDKERADRLQEELNVVKTERDTTKGELEAAKDELEDVKTERDTAQTESDQQRRRADNLVGELAKETQRADEAEDQADDLAKAVDESINKIIRQDAQRILAGIATTGAPASNSLAAEPKHGSPATLTTPNLNGSLGSSVRGWQKTTFSDKDSTNTDNVEIYSNIERAKKVDFEDSVFADDDLWETVNGSRVTDKTDEAGIELTDDDHGGDARSSRFPTLNQAGEVTQTLRRRPPTDAEKTAATSVVNDFNTDASNPRPTPEQRADASSSTTRDAEDYPNRWFVELPGTLRGASGTFRCTSADNDRSCTIERSGQDRVLFGTGWRFFPSGPKAQVDVPDGEHMWFGWWSRKVDGATPTEMTWAGYGVEPAATPASFDGATGTATYVGPAVGRYVVVDPIGPNSSEGRFEATATLRANFKDGTGAGTVSGDIKGFSNDPSWTVDLKVGSTDNISGRGASGAVSWSIGSGQSAEVEDGGMWSATLHSNFEGATTNNQPTGIVGAFTAQHGSQRKMIGAFGTQRR